VVVGERIEPMASDAGVDLIPDKTFAEALHPYALVVPGGVQETLRAMSNRAIRAYVRTVCSSILGSVDNSSQPDEHTDEVDESQVGAIQLVEA
jgi:hypothetical protein